MKGSIKILLSALIGLFTALVVFCCICYYKWSRFAPNNNLKAPLISKILLGIINGFIIIILEYQKKHSPYLNLNDYPFTKTLEANYPVIASEVSNYIRTKTLNRVPEYGSVDDHNRQLSQHDNKKWKVVVFKYYRDYKKDICNDFPETCRILKGIPQINLAMLSIMEGHKRLYPHRGPFKGIGRVHLAIDIPQPAAVLTVDDQDYTWVPGKCVAFDDTYVHSVHNRSPNYRIILFLDVMRPELPRWIGDTFRHPVVMEYFDKVNRKIEEDARRER